MRSMVAIAALEVRQRWILLPGALLVGTAGLLAPALGMGRVANPTIGHALAVLFALVAAAVMGWSTIGAELASQRLGFYFTRPVSWWAIFGGKLAAGVLLAVASGLLAWSPWLLSSHAGKDLRDFPEAAMMLSLVVMVFGIAHVASVAYGSRSFVVAVDLGLFALWLGALWLFGQNVAIGLASARLLPKGWPDYRLPALLALMTTAAAAWSLRTGRADARRVHAALSLGLWLLLFGALASVAGLGYWTLRTPPARLQGVSFVGTAPGDWTWVKASLREGWPAFWPAFLYRPSSGAFVRLGDARLATDPVVSADGRRAAFLKTGSPASLVWAFAGADVAGPRLVLVDLESPELRETEVRIGVPLPSRWNLQLAMAPNGKSLMVLQRLALTTFELPSGRHMFTVQASESEWIGPVVFPEPGRAIVFRRTTEPRTGPANPEGKSTIEIVSLDLATGAPSVTGRVDRVGLAWPRPDDRGDRLLVLTEGERWTLTLHDGATGRELGSLAHAASSLDAGFLADGRIIVVEARDGSASLSLRAARGALERTIALGPGRTVSLGGETQAGQLVVGVVHQGPEAILVSPASGRLERMAGLWPATASHPALRLAGTSGQTGDFTGPTLFRNERDELVRLDPVTLATSVLIGKER